MKKTLLLTISAGLVANFAVAQTYNNGGLSTGATSNSGVAAPAGYTWSEAQNNTGNTTESNSTAGSAGTYISVATSYFLADDFTIPEGTQWQITSIDVFAYQSGYTGTTCPFTAARVAIFSSDPSVTGAVSVFGDATTNRFASGTNSNMYRAFNSAVPSTSNPPGTTRIIWKVTANTPVTLGAGTYWIKYQLQNVIPANAGFFPPVTIPGNRGLPTFNAKQNDAILGTWTPLVDGGTPATAPDYTMDMAFIINATTLSTGEAVQFDNRIRVYPNPATDNFKISLPENIQIDGLEIYDISGKLVRTMPVAAEYAISDLAKGNYMVKIKSDALTKMTRLVKE